MNALGAKYTLGFKETIYCNEGNEFVKLFLIICWQATLQENLQTQLPEQFKKRIPLQQLTNSWIMGIVI